MSRCWLEERETGFGDKKCSGAYREYEVRQGGIRGDPVVTARNTWGTPGEGQEYQRNTRAKKLVKTKNTDYFALY